jgi:hypothetical protein
MIYQIVIIFFIILFTTIYYLLTRNDPDKHWNGLTESHKTNYFETMLYFTLISMANFGVSDITPKSKLIRNTFMIQTTLILLSIASLITDYYK